MSAKLPVIRVGGVPEHFNLPWHLAMERGIFEKHGVQVEWVEQKEGTGQMIRSAKDGAVDLIIALTEGLVSDIAKGIATKSDGEDELRILSTYVESPLNWAISTGLTSPYHDVESLNDGTWGISRYSSGSHLMALVLAHQRGWDLDALKFEVLGNFESLRNGVNRGTAAAFMWESFTTKPYYDSGEIRRIGAITSPWPCFMIAATRRVIRAHGRASAIDAVLRAIREACTLFHQEQDTMPAIIAERYSLTTQDALRWYRQVKLSASASVLQSALERTLSTLKEAKVLSHDNPCAPSDIIDTRFAVLETTDIKAMRLYNRPELITRTYNELKVHGWSQGDLDWQNLAIIDQQHHYHGTEAVDEAIRAAALNGDSNVINLGSGLGGTARYIAGKTGASVCAIELQADLSHVAQELTERTHLEDKVQHLAADFLAIHQQLRVDYYHAIVSWLTILHIPQRQELFEACRAKLVKGGVFYAEDWYQRKPFTKAEREILIHDVYCSDLPTEEEYKASLHDAGLAVIKFEDLTEDWTQYTAIRVAKFEEHREQLVAIHDVDLYERLLYFYQRVRDLFAGGHLGGVRIVAQK